MKSKKINEAQFLSLLQRILPKATSDSKLATAIYEQVEREVQLLKNLDAFEKFCEEGSIENLEPETLSNLKEQLASSFGEENIAIAPDETGAAVDIEVALPDRQIHTKLRVQDPNEIEEEVKAPFVPFPISLDNDPELVWMLARRENLGPDEAARALFHIQEEFWGSKNGQLLLRKGAERTFAEFIARVPATALGESGMRRHYKDPETLKVVHPAESGAAPRVEKEVPELAVA